MANYVYIAQSIDGYIATKDGGIDWLMEIPNPDDSDFGFSEFMQRVDGIIMGRNTFEKLLTFDQWIYTKPLFVLSNSLSEVPGHVADKAEVVSGEIPDVLAKLKDRGYHNFYIDGGKLIQSFLKLDLIDEMIITTIPTVLGDGIPLFGSLDEPIRFRLNKIEQLTEFLAKSHFVKKSTSNE